jgi:hypothetical protein
VKDLPFDCLQFGDFARYLRQAGREPVNAARYLLLCAGDPVTFCRTALRSSDSALNR